MSQLQEQMQAQIEEMQRKIKQLERDNRMLAVMNENAKRLRLSYEAEKKVQYLYNDLLLEHSPNMIFMFNEQLHLMLWSKACLELLSATDSEGLLKLPFTKLFSSAIQPEWIDKVYKQNQEVLCGNISCKYNDTIFFGHGEIIHAQVTIAPILDGNHCLGTLMTINDITELTIATQDAEDAAQSRSRFLANMSHEIRTPMNVVKGLGELLNMTDLDERQQKYVNNIMNASDSLLSIIDDVLDFSKIDANKIKLTERQYSVVDMLIGILQGMNIRIEGKGLCLLVEMDPRLPVTLSGDDSRIRQVITNLLSNAIKYTSEGYIRIVIHSRKREGVTFLRLSIEDSGMGIREDELPYIFDAFTRVDLERNRSIMGTGLGLAISKQLVLAMGGRLWAKSTYGKGSTFTFEVPQEVVDSNHIAYVHNKAINCLLLFPEGKFAEHIQLMMASLKVSHKLVADITRVSESSDFTHCIFDDSFDENDIRRLRRQLVNCHFTIVKSMNSHIELSEYYDYTIERPVLVTDFSQLFHMNKEELNSPHAEKEQPDDISIVNTALLVVDDNEINQSIVTEILSSFGAVVESADNGLQAVEICQKKVYDIIFMDHMMPVMDGIEATFNIRNDKGPNQKTPIVALTANVANDMRSSYLKSGMNDLIAKPIDMKEIKRVLHKWLPKDKIQ